MGNGHTRNEMEAFTDGYGERRRSLEERNGVVRRPIPRVDDSFVKRKKNVGRVAKYTPVRLKNEINRYFQWCEDHDEVPSIKGMMIHLKYNQDTIYKLVQNPLLKDIIEHARLIIANWAEADVYATKGLAAGKIAYMKNVHNWADKLETQNFTEQRVITVDEAKAKLAMLAPKLLELMKDRKLVEQLADRTEVVDAEVVEPRRI